MGAKKLAQAQAPGRKRILLVDDHPVLRAGIKASIDAEPELEVCGEAATAAQALEAIRKLKPDLVLTDLALPGKSGLELVRDIRAVHPDLPVLVFSMHEESLFAGRALRAGATGYLGKQETPGKMVQAIRQVLGGRLFVTERMAERVLQSYGRPKAGAAQSPIEGLSDREFEVFQLLSTGKASDEIARSLHLSPKTVAVHRTNIRKKLGLKTLSELICYAVRWGATEQRA